MARVVLTAPRPRVGTVAEALRADGHEVLELPFVSIEPLTNEPAQRALLASLAQFDVAIFVSPSAVAAVLDARSERWPERVRPAVVGPGSLEALAARGLDTHPGLLVPDGPIFDAAALLRHPALAEPSALRVLVVRAEGGNPRIDNELARRGARVSVLAAYRRQPVEVDARTRATLSDWLDDARSTPDQDPVLVVTTVDVVEQLEGLAREPGALQRLRAARSLTIHPRIAERLAQVGCSRVRLIAPGIAPLRAALESELGEPMVPRNAVEPNVTENDPRRSTEPTASDGETDPAPAAATGIVGESDRQSAEPASAAIDVQAGKPSEAVADKPADKPIRRSGRSALVIAVIALLAALAAGAWSMVRFERIESQLTRRLQAIDQRGIALDSTLKQAQDLGRDMQGRLAVLEGKFAATAGLQAQVDKLYRDRAEDSFEVTLVETESGLALAAQQLALGANPQSVLARLEDLQSRLERENDPRLAPLRAALLKDIERLRGYPATDVGSLALRIDALIGALDQLPLLSAVREPAGMSSGVVAAADAQPAGRQSSPPQRATPQQDPTPQPGPTAQPGPTPQQDPGSAPAQPSAPTGEQAGPAAADRPSIGERLRRSLRALGDELRALFQVRRIDSPDVMLVAPEQAYFLRQNLRLMLLDARLALLTRNDAVYRSDLERARRWLDSYYDTEHRNVEAVNTQLRQLLDAKLMLEPPRIDDSLAAVRAARAGGR